MELKVETKYKTSNMNWRIKLLVYRFLENLFKFERKHGIKGVAYNVILWEIRRNYKYFMKKPIDMKKPCDLNEKINWLKLHGDFQLWGDLSDKYKVREFIERKGLKDTLIPLYGVWNSVKDINFDALPDSFVLKTNHGSGDVIIVRDKNQCDRDTIVKELEKFLKMPYGIGSGEPHYLYIKPRVIAEELLIPTDAFSTSLVDYKIWCFNGRPHHVWSCYSRSKHEVKVEIHFLDWSYHPECSVFNEHYRDGGNVVPRPENFEKMLEIASKLSEGFKEVRVDLYNQDGKIYFGEMTFTGNGGYMDFYTKDFLLEMGKQFSVEIKD